jgi:HSP20 family protein
MTGGKRMNDDKKNGGKVDLSINLGGIADIFKGVANLIDLVGRMDKEGRTEFTRSGEIKGLGKKGFKGVYGFSVKLGGHGQPEVEQFGNIRGSNKGPVVEDIREPITDVFEEETHVLVVAELPGVDENEISAELKNDILVINAASKAIHGRQYAKEVLISVPVIPGSLSKQYKNGILEIRIERVQEDSGI